MIYLGLFGSQLAALLLTDWASRARLRLYYCLLIFLFVFAAFRFEVGCDWSGYFNQWSVAQGLSFGDAAIGREPLWWLIMSALQNLGAQYIVINAFAALVFFVGINHLARPDQERQPYVLTLIQV